MAAVHTHTMYLFILVFSWDNSKQSRSFGSTLRAWLRSRLVFILNNVEAMLSKSGVLALEC